MRRPRRRQARRSSKSVKQWIVNSASVPSPVGKSPALRVTERTDPTVVWDMAAWGWAMDMGALPMASAAMAMAAPAFIHPRSLTVASSRATEISQAGAKAGRGSCRKRRCDAVLPNVPDRHHALGDHFQPPAKLLARTPLWDSRPTHEESRLRPVFGQSLSGTRRARRGAAPPLGETVERPQDVVVARADGYKMCQDGQRRARPRHIEASWP